MTDKTSIITNEEYARVADTEVNALFDYVERLLPETLVENVNYSNQVVGYDDKEYVVEKLHDAQSAWQLGMHSSAVELLLNALSMILPNTVPVVARHYDSASPELDYHVFGTKSENYYGKELRLLTGHQIHCDSLVLHRPGECEFCDKHGSVQQQYRIANRINFTGEKNPDKRPCPAELERGDMCQVWGGNVPSTVKDIGIW